MPNLLLHLTSNLVLVAIVYLFSKYVSKKNFNWKFATILLFSSNLMDLDHLLASPIYDPLRCSINFHPLHSWYMFPIYAIGLFLKKYSFLFIGTILHLALDYADCFF